MNSQGKNGNMLNTTERPCTPSDAISWAALLDTPEGKALGLLKPVTYELWDGDAAVLIMHEVDGEEWSNQAGGVACTHPSVKGKGFLLPYFTGDCLCSGRSNYADMQRELNQSRLPIKINGGEEANLDVTVSINGANYAATIFYENCD